MRKKFNCAAYHYASFYQCDSIMTRSSHTPTPQQRGFKLIKIFSWHFSRWPHLYWKEFVHWHEIWRDSYRVIIKLKFKCRQQKVCNCSFLRLAEHGLWYYSSVEKVHAKYKCLSSIITVTIQGAVMTLFWDREKWNHTGCECKIIHKDARA